VRAADLSIEFAGLGSEDEPLPNLNPTCYTLACVLSTDSGGVEVEAPGGASPARSTRGINSLVLHGDSVFGCKTRSYDVLKCSP
jgi:hypothetical protein